MLEKIIVLLLMYFLVLIADFHVLKNAPNYSKGVYIGMMAVALYFSLDYLSAAEFPDLNTLADAVLTKPSKMIVELLKVKPS